MRRATLLVALLPLWGCATVHETDTRRALADARNQLALEPRDAPPIDGTLGTYVAHAIARSPAIRGDFERWRAATLRIGAAGRMPEPTVTYAFYVLPVQTRVGPQRHRVSVRQELPWPTAITAATDAQSLRARASQRRFEAGALSVRARVADAWWRLWQTRAARDVRQEQLAVLGGLGDTLRGRLEIGEASVAEVAQVELRRARLEDSIDGLEPIERTAEAALRAAAGLPVDADVPTRGAPPNAALPLASEAQLREAIPHHPFLLAFALRADAAERQAGAHEAARFPRLTLGVDWIETGEAMTPVSGNGNDALIVQVGLSVPLWQDRYESAQRAAEADAEAERSDREAATDAAMAELAAALSGVRDARRRTRTAERTLLPQATSAYESVLGAYAVGRVSAAAALLAHRELLEIALEALAARADHGRAWARLEAIVGQPVEPALDVSQETSR